MTRHFLLTAKARSMSLRQIFALTAGAVIYSLVQTAKANGQEWAMR